MAKVEDHYKNVFVHHFRTEDELLEVNPKYAYMMIPAEYVCVYHKLLVYLTDFGQALVNDCSAACKAPNKTVVDCWNMFQSALACYNLGRTKEADFYIEYINKQLELIYRGTGKDVYDDTFVVPLDEEGHISSIVSCGNNTKFNVDFETGKLIQQYEGKEKQVYSLIDEGLNSRALDSIRKEETPKLFRSKLIPNLVHQDNIIDIVDKEPEPEIPEVKYKVNITSEFGPSSFVATGIGEYSEGEKVTITVNPTERYKFLRLLVGNNMIIITNTYTFNIYENINIVVELEKLSLHRTVSYGVYPAGKITGTVNIYDYNGILTNTLDGYIDRGFITYHKDTNLVEASLTANDIDNYIFLGWYKGTTDRVTDATLYSTNKNISFTSPKTTDDDETIDAYWAKYQDIYPIEVDIETVVENHEQLGTFSCRYISQTEFDQTDLNSLFVAPDVHNNENVYIQIYPKSGYMISKVEYIENEDFNNPVSLGSVSNFTIVRQNTERNITHKRYKIYFIPEKPKFNVTIIEDITYPNPNNVPSMNRTIKANGSIIPSGRVIQVYEGDIFILRYEMNDQHLIFEDFESNNVDTIVVNTGSDRIKSISFQVNKDITIRIKAKACYIITLEYYQTYYTLTNIQTPLLEQSTVPSSGWVRKVLTYDPGSKVTINQNPKQDNYMLNAVELSGIKNMEYDGDITTTRSIICTMDSDIIIKHTNYKPKL